MKKICPADLKKLLITKKMLFCVWEEEFTTYWSLTCLLKKFFVFDLIDEVPLNLKGILNFLITYFGNTKIPMLRKREWIID